MIYKIIRTITFFLLAFTVAVMAIWGALVLLNVGTFVETIGHALSVGFSLFLTISLVGLLFPGLRWKVLNLYVSSVGRVIAWLTNTTPTNDKEWQDDVAVLAHVVQDKNLFTFHNIRNFSYRSEIAFTPAYYDKTFDIEKLTGIDAVAVYWRGPAVAHIFVSFVFLDGERLAVSIELRRVKGEKYSTLKSFLNHYELCYVVADERDVIGVRTNYRVDPVEDVYIYPVEGTLEEARHLFLTYVEKINALVEYPEFYNALTTNCTTNIWLNANTQTQRIPFSWKVLISGYVPQYLYESGRLQTSGLSFEALKKRAHVNERAKALGIVEDFSEGIRARSTEVQ